MGGTRAAVAAAIVSAEKDGSGADGALHKLRDAKYDVEGTPFLTFIKSYFK
ncbi:MAG: hypothetical protein NVS3B16_17880 [Vulcanimicrobiaceae bacterium]